MTPEMAVISMGNPSDHAMWTAWRYGHPRRDAVEMLEAGVSGRRPAAKSVLVAEKVKVFKPRTMSAAIYATGWDGDLTVSAGSDGVLSVATGQ